MWPWSVVLRDKTGDRHAWASLYAQVAGQWKKNKPPRIQVAEMFREADAQHLHEADYSFLSSIAHGSPPTLVASYATAQIQVHDDQMLPAILKASLKYTLISVGVWNTVFELADVDRLQQLTTEAISLSVGPTWGPAGA
jgi:hypothetical protein